MSTVTKRNVKGEKSESDGLGMVMNPMTRKDDADVRPARTNSMSSQLKRFSSRRSMSLASKDGE